MGQKGKQLQMLIVILPDTSGSYGEYQKDSRSAFFWFGIHVLYILACLNCVLLQELLNECVKQSLGLFHNAASLGKHQS